MSPASDFIPRHSEVASYIECHIIKIQYFLLKTLILGKNGVLYRGNHRDLTP